MKSRWHFFSASLIVSVCMFVAPSTVSAGYSFVDLGGFNQGMGDWANAINEQGEIVGVVFVFEGFPSQHAFLYRDGLLTDINPVGSLWSVASDINNLGTIVGQYSINGEVHGFAFKKSGEFIDLNPLLSSGGTSFYSVATNINENDLIAGQFTTNNINYNVFLYNLSTDEFKDIGRLGDAAWPTGINDYGQVVGQYSEEDGSVRSFIYQNGEMTDLNLPEVQESTNYASDINNNGQIVGEYQDLDWMVHGYLYQLNGQTIELHDGLPENINNNGQIVGATPNEHGIHQPGVYDNGEWTLLDSPFIDFSDRGLDINEFGEVVGSIAGHAALWTLKSIIPTIVEQCKNDGWKKYMNPTFKNQGDCVSFVVSSK